jgi:hypothetical protein
MNYALDNPIKRKVYVPEKESGYTPNIQHNSQLDQTHRNLTWQYDNRQQVIGNQSIPESARLEKKK